MAKCNNDCFNCPYNDCIVNGITTEDRKEIRERDNRYYNAVSSNWIVNGRPTRARKRNYHI